MSKKQINSRLENLFSSFEEQESPLPLLQPDVLPGWNWETDGRDRYISISSEVSESLGLPSSSFIGQPVSNFAVAPQYQAMLRKLIEERALPAELDLYFQSAEGAFLPVRLHMFPRPANNGEGDGVRGFATVLSGDLPEIPQATVQQVVITPKEKPVDHAAKAERDNALDSISAIYSDGEVISKTPTTWSNAALNSLREMKLVAHPAEEDKPAAIAAPIPLRDRATGLLEILGEDGKRKWSQDERLLVQEVANQLGQALERQLLLRQAQRRALELQTAAEIARDTSSTLSLEVLMKRMVELIRDRFNFYHASIFLLDDSGEFAVVRESTGQAGEDMKRRGHRLAVGSRSVIGQATATGEPFIVGDVTSSPNYYPNPLLPNTRSEIGLPLKIGNRVTGALDIQSTEVNAFSDAEVAVLRILADQIAVAIENARSYELAQKAVEELQEVDRIKSQFLANMSHELRTPLNSIIGFSRVIIKGIDGPINEIQEQDLTSIYNSGQHLLGLINDILDLSKIEAGKMELAFTDVNIPDLINSVMSTAIGLVKDKPVKLLTDVQPDLPIVTADPTRVRQVLLNFLSNASKFTEQGSITTAAKIVVGPEGKPELLVTVTDTGDGIAEEDRVKLFLPFSQVDDSPTRKTGGTGLGLSICRSFIEMHGGRIGLLSSEIGKGSTFFFTLPLPQVPEPEAEEQQADDEGVIRILSIDDDLQVIQLYQRYLEPHGYKVIALTDPKQAVAMARQIQPYAITLDVMMPEHDGWQVVHDLKNDPETRSIPVIMCSILEEEEKGFSLGAADYLVKPFLQEDLISAVHRLETEGKIREIMVVDDSEEDIRLVQKILEEQAGFRVTPALGGEQALSTLQTITPDAIILDLFMPDMNGFTLLEKFRSDPQLSRIPVLILTGADLTAEQYQQLVEFGPRLLTKGMLRENELLTALEDSLKKIRA